MKKTRKNSIIITVSLLLAFVIWTLLVKIVDVEAIGPNNTKVGFATLNGAFHAFTGVNMMLYAITDWLGLVPVAVVLGYGFFGLVQWIKRKSILKVDRDIIALGIFYVAVVGVYVLFEYLVINYRPILIEGYLEASYPSSTTMLVACVMPTAMIWIKKRIRNSILRRATLALIAIFIGFMVISRLISGVHWLSDIVGGILVSSGLVSAYFFATGFDN